MEQGLVLVGVVHRDPQGEARLGALLRRLAPQAVGLELAEPSLAARREHGAPLQKKLVDGLRAAGREDLARLAASGSPVPGVAGELLRALELPYELRAAEAWSRESGAKVALLDDPTEVAAAVARLTGEVYEEENVRLLLEEEARGGQAAADPVCEQYALARRYLADPQLFRYHFGREEAKALEARDAYVARGLADLCAQDARVVYVAGWEHLVDGGLATIGPLLGERARRVLLCDALEREEGP
jgi:hypothetical protein